MNGQLNQFVGEFAEKISSGEIEIYNEFSLQHEFGTFVRSKMTGVKVQYERNVKYFFGKGNFVKQEIDLAIFHDKNDLHTAIEFKYPRNGQVPMQMFSFCKDIAFLEQLKMAGFKNAYFVAYTEDPHFYSGKADGIYAYFRNKKNLTGTIQQPVGNDHDSVTLMGNYTITWRTVIGNLRYAMVEIV